MFKNGQMGIIIPGVRVNVEIKTEECIRQQLDETGITTWEDFIEQSKSRRLYGNTKLTDLPILVAIYKFELNLITASRHLGYAPSVRKNGKLYYTSRALMFRLRRMNVDNIFNIIEPFIEKGIVTRENIRHILAGKTHYKRGERLTRNNSFFKYYAKKYVTDAVCEFMDRLDSTATYDQILQLVSNHIGVSVKTLWYWLNMEVENIMVQSTY